MSTLVFQHPLAEIRTLICAGLPSQLEETGSVLSPRSMSERWQQEPPPDTSSGRELAARRQRCRGGGDAFRDRGPAHILGIGRPVL